MVSICCHRSPLVRTDKRKLNINTEKGVIMKINPMNFVSFNAKVGREAKISTDYNTGKTTITNKGTLDCMDTYDNEIVRLKKLQNAAYRLDSFMRSKEVEELAQQLPEEGILNMRLSYNDYFSRTEENPYGYLGIHYEEPRDNLGCKIARANDIELRDANYVARDYESCNPIDKNGTIDEQHILGWMQKLVNLFDSDCKIDK